MKKRADILLVEKKLAETRSKAQAMIMAGQIYYGDKKILKSGELYNSDAELISKNLNPIWVSRGALKLNHFFENFDLNVNGFNCLDIGASTGGFTQILLTKKVNKVYCVDVGTNQLHEKIIRHPKVINIPKTNARYLSNDIIPEIIDLIVCDVSFISMKKVLKPSLFLLSKSGIIVGLIKPQFESEKNEIKKGGVIKDHKIHDRICKDFEEWFKSECKMDVLGIIPSPIKGPKGNIEFLIYARK